MHGGTVTASSGGSGQGSTFVVKLPLTTVRSEVAPPPSDRRQSATPSSTASSDRVPMLTGLRILVVDDEPDARELLKRILGEYEAQVEVAASADEAMAAIAAQVPDVLVSDIGMPDEDGYELIRKLRSAPPEKGGLTPAIALTGYASRKDRERALAAGYHQHIAKPIEQADMIDAIAALVGRGD